MCIFPGAHRRGGSAAVGVAVRKAPRIPRAVRPALPPSLQHLQRGRRSLGPGKGDPVPHLGPNTEDSGIRAEVLAQIAACLPSPHRGHSQEQALLEEAESQASSLSKPFQPKVAAIDHESCGWPRD